MNKIYFFILLLFSCYATSQIVNIPDPILKARLLSASTFNTIASTQTPINNPDTWTGSVSTYTKIDTNNDGEIQVSEAQAIKYLDINSTNITNNALKITNAAGLDSFTNLETFICRENKIPSLDVTMMSNLKSLDCGLQLVLTSLNVSGLNNLINVTAFLNALTSVNFTGCYNLLKINFSSNDLTSFNVSHLSYLTSLYCATNNLTTLNLSNLANLKAVHIPGNQINSLNVSGCTSLYTLECQDNLINSLDVSNLVNLNSLQCYENEMVTLNATGCSGLANLVCRNNSLTSLLVSGCTNLGVLHCYDNQLQTLNIEGLTSLEYLRCYYNQLTTLDATSCGALKLLTCGANQLTSLYVKNNNQVSWIDLNFGGNPNLTYICADEGDFTLVQNLITQNNLVNCHFNSYCSFTPNGTFYEITGSTTFDGDNNGCNDTDTGFPYMKYIVSDGTATGLFISDGEGDYYFPGNAGTYTIYPSLENPSYFNVTPTSLVATFPLQTSPMTQNFCITPNGIHHDLEVVLIPLTVARPGFDANYKIIYKNKGNVNENATISLNFNDALLDFVDSSNPPTSQNDGVLTWSVENISPFDIGEILINFNINSPVETPPVNGGDILTYVATISGLNADETPSNNTSTLNQQVVNSFDPNDKTCLEGNVLAPTMIGQYLHYLIRFENTGTYPAENIVVKDVIDITKFNLGSLIITDTSHPCRTRVSNNGLTEFIFEDINLPFEDSVNDGYVAFKIRTNSALTVGTQIANNANIYFDYNYPIITNTATSTFQALSLNDLSFDNYVTLSPNPGKDILHIETREGIAISSMSFYNMLGQVVQTVIAPSNVIDVSLLQTGNYLVKILSDKGVGNLRFVKN